MSNYVNEHSIVRKIWGKSDTILLIFAGAAAEFALNKAVDWLYFTGRLPSDPLGRLFSTVAYAREIIFSSDEQATAAIDKMNKIHAAVENARGESIPTAAYRDVLFMLIHYSISSFEVLERKLTDGEKEDVIDVFCRVGKQMNIPGLPRRYDEWLQMYDEHMMNDLRWSKFTTDLFRQYRRHLGPVRYFVLIEAQKVVVPPRVRFLLDFNAPFFTRHIFSIYKYMRRFRGDYIVKALLLPPLYKQRIRMLDVQPGTSW
jgi:uncharacterized protein (DUF2236 family)